MTKIAVIEDNHEMRENIQEILELADYEVVTAANGKEGIEVVKNTSPDLIICDIMMPELDGYGVLFYLSKNPITSKIPFIFLTAKTERADMRKGMNLGADDYIAKPFEEMELLEAIESRLKKKEVFASIKSLEDKWQGFKKAVKDLSGLENLIQDAVIKEYPKKTIVYNQNDKPKFLFRVQKGHVRTYKVSEDAKELVTGIYGPGDFFGYSELLKKEVYSEYAMSMEGAELVLINAEDFETLMLSDRDVSLAFIDILAGDLLEKEQALLSMAYNSVRKRVADALVTLYYKYKSQLADRVEITVSRDELASMVGTATESVIRILSEFKNDGFIKSKGSLITVVDIEQLSSYRY
ncbi:MAG: response regulator [Crocinitomicaceae bacterium]|nr:response regulator [Crocinitomicaceae bacterium]